MKKLLLTIALLLATNYLILAQAPPAINYQAVARNASGAELANQTISLRISFKNNSANGATVYSETHTGVNTNQFGLFTIELGNGTAVTGTFGAIDWSTGAKFLKVEMDPNNGTAYLDMGTTQLLSVPYALYAAQSGSGSGAQSLNDLSDVNTTGVTPNQVLQWNGTSWIPATVSGTDSQTLTLAGNNLSISNGNTVTLPTGAADNWGTQSVVTGTTLTGNGTSSAPLGIAQMGASSGQALKWNGTTWAPANDVNTDSQTLTLAGSSLSISGGNSVTLPSGSDSQTLSLAGNSLSISNGNSVTLPTGTTYTAGTGINIAGNVISNTGDADNSTSNEIQTLSLAGSTLSLSNGGGSVTLPGGGGGLSGGGTNNFIARFTPNGTTLNNSIMQDDGNYVGINNAPITTDRLNINAGNTTTGGLRITSSNTGANTYGLFSTNASNGNAYLNYIGTINLNSLTANNPVVYGASSSGSNPGIFGACSGTNTSAAIVGISSNWHGGAFFSNDNAGLAAAGSGLLASYSGADTSQGVLALYSGSSTGQGLLSLYNSTGTAPGIGAFGAHLTQVANGVGVAGYNDFAGLTTTGAIGVEGSYNPGGYGIGTSGIGYLGTYPTGATDYGVYGAAGTGGFAVYANGDLTCTGAKNASVGTSQGNQLVYSMESPEVWFEDFGRATLQNGQVTVNLDPLFLETVKIDEQHPMIITVTPEGDCKGLYVIPGTTSFVVKELNGGNSNINFSFRITAKRLNYEDHRFGADLSWDNKDTRNNYQYVTPKPIDYSEALKLQQIQKSKQSSNVLSSKSKILGISQIRSQLKVAKK
jgi:hypothetical protein